MKAAFITVLALTCFVASAAAQQQAGSTSTTETHVMPAAPQPADGAHWTQRPSASDFARYYPPGAMHRNVSGRAVLDCLVVDGGSLNCTAFSEEPAGWGFGEAAVNISHAFRMAPLTTDGRSTVGGRVRVPLTFRMR